MGCPPFVVPEFFPRSVLVAAMTSPPDTLLQEHYFKDSGIGFHMASPFSSMYSNHPFPPYNVKAWVRGVEPLSGFRRGTLICQLIYTQKERAGRIRPGKP